VPTRRSSATIVAGCRRGCIERPARRAGPAQAAHAVSPAIRRFDAAAEFETAERCAIVESSNDPSDPQVSIARARVAPGVVTAWHRLRGTTERYVVLEGRGRVEVGALAPVEVGPGDVVVIPPSCRQRITNVGECDLLFLAICSPRFEAAAYESLDDASDDR
jgi:mannose-6-phosphate isomerase-like protein (cupin superfamily)